MKVVIPNRKRITINNQMSDLLIVFYYYKWKILYRGITLLKKASMILWLLSIVLYNLVLSFLNDANDFDNVRNLYLKIRSQFYKYYNEINIDYFGVKS